jgi:FG-GAP repeat
VRNHRFTALAASVLLLTGAGITAAASAGAAPLPPPATHDDFNGDGYADLVVGAPSATVDGHKGAGYVTVLYGSAKGLSTANHSVISQSTSGVPGTPETGDAFGAAYASADFDGDGFADLAVAAPHEAIGSTANAGGVTVLWGSAKGLTGNSTWIQDDTPQAGGLFGRGLAAGNFDGGQQELAVLTSSTLWTYTFVADAPSAQPKVTRSSAKRALSAARSHATAAGAAAADGVYPTGLAAGDYNNDHTADLILLGTSVVSGTSHGWSSYLQGSADGPTWSRDFDGGPVAATGDLNGDGFDDLATAYPTQSGSSGTVKIWYGGANGPWGKTGADDAAAFTQDSPGVPGTAETGDHWGSDLSIGDVNGDHYPDLAIGADGEDIGSISNAGAVWLLRGSAQGITGTGAQSFDQNSANVPGAAETSDRFGGQVRLIDANSDGKAGLVAAAPGENTNDGVAWVFSGTASGLTATGSWTFGGGSVNAPSADAQFGSTIAK